MISAGYLYKQVSSRSDWLGKPGLPQRIYSMSPHISCDFAEYVSLSLHNGFWPFDRPEIVAVHTVTAALTLLASEPLQHGRSVAIAG